MSNAYIRSYNPASQSMANLRRLIGPRKLGQLGVKQSTKTTHAEDIIFNWGSTIAVLPKHRGWQINPPTTIALATNKLKFFNRMKQAPARDRPRIPSYTTDIPQAVAWVENDQTVVCRMLLTSHSGKGIILYTPEDYRNNKELPVAPLYTLYTKKQDEYRVHFRGDAGDVFLFYAQEKKRVQNLAEGQNGDYRIRNHKNGFIYAMQNVNPPPDVLEQARRAARASQLHFGAVDVIYNARDGAAYVLEINTAPGLEGTTLEKYKTEVFDYYIEQNLKNLEMLEDDEPPEDDEPAVLVDDNF